MTIKLVFSVPLKYYIIPALLHPRGLAVLIVTIARVMIMREGVVKALKVGTLSSLFIFVLCGLLMIVMLLRIMMIMEIDQWSMLFDLLAVGELLIFVVCCPTSCNFLHNKYVKTFHIKLQRILIFFCHFS